jgi:hypothetical protein
MRRTIALAAGAALVATMLPGGSASAGGQNHRGPSDAERVALDAGAQLATKETAAGKAPEGANPYLALVPDASQVDYAGWRQWMKDQAASRAAQKAAQRRVAAPPILVDEREPSAGSNDSPATAQPVPGFGTRNRQNNRARILGALTNEAVTPTALPPNTELDSARPLARDTGVQNLRSGMTTTGVIGDSPQGSTGTDTGDFDFYKITVTQPGETLTVNIDTPTGLLDPMAALYTDNPDQNLPIAFNDDAVGLDSRLRFRFTTAGTYFVMVTGFNAIPADPDVPTSGPAGGGSEGAYNALIQISALDFDFYSVDLRKGDVVGATVKGAATVVSVYDAAGREVHGSSQDATSLYPVSSPLPGGGNAVTDHVADTDGLHYVAVTGGSGAYDITVEAYRSVLEGNPAVQTLFLDFDGARINTGIFGGPGVRELSPLRSFLGRWGLTNADENALIDGIVAEVTESIREDMIASGLNDQFRLRVLNSRDHADPFGQPDVSRVIVGGTIAESGIPTIGIAQFIDPGNFGTEDSALVLLDVMSNPAGPASSLNTYLRPESNRVGFVAQAVGNVTAHEAGHFFGNWHTSNATGSVPNIQDAGGANFQVLFGVGPDGVGGTADDLDVDFGEDVFHPAEGFTGIEDTLSRIAGVME